MSGRRKVLLSWSSGKDSAWCLHGLRQERDVEVAGLITTVHEATHRVAAHGVRERLLEHQAAACGLPLIKVPIPDPCPNERYEQALGAALQEAKAQDVAAVCFGDFFATLECELLDQKPLCTQAGPPRIPRLVALFNVLATITALVLMACDPSSLSTAPPAACTESGAQCQLPEGPLGVCERSQCPPGEVSPCFKCTPQH